MAALEAEAQAAAEQAEAEGRKHPGCPRTKPSATFTDAESRIMPGLVGETSYRLTTARRWWTMSAR